MEIPHFIDDDEAKLYYNSLRTQSIKIIDGASYVNLNKVENQDFSDSLDVLDTSSEPPINSLQGRIFSLLAATITPTNQFTILTLALIYGSDFLKACIVLTLFLSMPLMFLEILIGQFTAVNVSSLYSKMALAWNMVRIVFVMTFYISGVYSLICSIYYLTEGFNIVNDMTTSKISTKTCPENIGGSACLRHDLAYFCLYGPKENKYFDECRSYYDNFEKGYYRQDMNDFYNARFIEKSQYTFGIIPNQQNSFFAYLSCLIVWLFIAILKRNGYATNSGIMVFFYISYVLSLLGLLVTLLLRESFLPYVSYFFNAQTSELKNIDITIWIIAAYQMLIMFKSGQGVVMKISSYFPTGTNTTNISFLVCAINLFVVLIQIFISIELYGAAVNRDIKDHTVALLKMSKNEIRTYISSSLALYIEDGIGSARSFALILNFMIAGLSTYQAFIYIDLLDCELHNMSIRHNRYVTTRYKTTAAITFLFLLIPIFSIIYPTVGIAFFIIQETFDDFELQICLWQLLLIIFGVGYEKLRIPGGAKVQSHVLKFLIGKYFTFILIPGLGILLSLATFLEDQAIVEWKMYIRESTVSFFNEWIHNIVIWLARLCIIIWPLFQMLRAVFYGKKPTSIFNCQLMYTKQ